MLLDLNVTDDPVWVYLDSQHSHVLAKMKTTHDYRVAFIEGTSIFGSAQPLLTITPSLLGSL
jgi:exocyst complex component 2